MLTPLEPGTLLQNRYRVMAIAAQGRLGWTYLAQDHQRYNELCVLKELIPADPDPTSLELLKQWIQDDIAILYDLYHPQLARFRGVITYDRRLYLVRQYIQGKSCGLLLDERQQQSRRFSQVEVMALLSQILPVLTYLHCSGVIHQNLNLNSIILRHADQLPVLINVGLTPALKAQLQRYPVAPETLGHLNCYAPPLRQSAASAPQADLYALAVVAIALLTGQPPEQLFDSKTQRWHWQAQAIVHPAFAQLLQTLLQPNRRRQLITAKQVQRSLNSLFDLSLHVPVSPPSAPSAPPSPSSSSPPSSFHPSLASALLATSLSVLIAVIAWRVVSAVNPPRTIEATSEIPPSSRIATPPTPSLPPVAPSPMVSPSPPLPTVPDRETGLTEQAALAALRDRRRQLGISYPWFTDLVDEAFYKKHPDLQGQKLGNAAAQQSLRQEWATIGTTLLDRLATLSPETLAQLGNCKSEVLSGTNDRSSGRDDRFDQLFPELQGQELNPATFGQIRCAIAAAPKSPG